jgi:hypothetical protein
VDACEGACKRPHCASGQFSGCALVPSAPEIASLAVLLFCIGLLAVSRSDEDSGRIGWIAVLSFQSLPYAAAVICRLIERSHTSGVEQPVSETFGRPADPEAAA